MKKRTKTLILCISIFVVAAVSGFGLWYLLHDRTPVGNGNVLDVAWYHENGTEFVISTADELFELAELSQHYDFKDQTIKLGADIVVNEGNAEDWELVMPERRWEPITGFAGTFDGQGHTVSGLYGLGHFYGVVGAKTVYYTTGMFADTQADCVIKNFKLVNSYFNSDLNEGVGSISSYGGGTFDSIYTDATIVTYKSGNGGIIGIINKKTTITNCWYDGEIRVEGTVGRFTGGIVGRICANNGQSKIEHCLNTADISSTVVNRGMNLGGLVGVVESQARVNIDDCLTVGDITVDYTSVVGSFIGGMSSSSAVIVKNAYTKAESFMAVIGIANGTMTGAPLAHNEETLTGFDAYKWTTLDFDKYWAVVEDGTPILQSFASEIPSVKGMKKAFDTSWYSMAQSEFLLTTPEQLYGLGILSYSTDFSGSMIALGEDIVLNEGDAKEWAEKAPATRWIPIGTYGYPFEGTFEGNGHTISGLYMNTCGNFGMFGETGSSSLIMNLRLENSYLKTFGATIGSIVGRGAGIIQNVYSNAIVTGERGNIGGLVGQAVQKKGLTLMECWYDGTATNLGNLSNTKKLGGLIGTVRSNSAVTNCLNTGTIDASVFDYNQSKTDTPNVVPIVGGLIGYVESKVTLDIQNCLNVGKVLHSEAATAAFASAIGYIDGDVNAYNLYATTESCDRHPLKKSVSGQVCPIDTADLTGFKAYQWTLLDFEKFWAVDKNGTPILKYFASETPSVAGVKKEVDVSWYDVSKKVYTLDSREDLLGFRLMSYNTDFAEKTVKLGKDITLNTGDASKWAKGAPKYKWTPIGSEKYPFMGNFDGGMHTISGIYLKNDVKYGGFFALLKQGSTVKNLKIVNSYFESSESCFGSIAGSGNANLSNIYSNAIVVSSNSNTGGLVGQITKDVKIENCWFDGSVTITGTGMPNRRAAGIAADLYSGKITLSHCLNTGTIAAPNYSGTNSETSTAVVPLVGGLVSHIHADADVVIEDSLNTGKIIANKAATTGYASVIGYSSGKTKVVDTFATKESCESPVRGEYTGHVSTYDKADISGYGGYQWLTLNFDKYWAVAVSPTAGTPILKSFTGSVPSLAGVEKLLDTSWYSENKTTFVLKDKADLNGFAYLSKTNDFAGKTVKLGADIVMNADMKNPAYKWDPIGSKSKPFKGTFDGQMHTISGIYMITDVEASGFFARTDKEATVKNFALKDSYFESTAMNLGSIAGIGHGTFDTIKSEATVVGHNTRVGGFIGMNSAKGTSLTKCWFAGSVTHTGNADGKRGTGGLVGVMYNDSELVMKNCLNTGTVDASAYEYNSKTASNPQVVVLAGGLVGQVRTGAVLTLGNTLNTGVVKVSDKSADSANGFIGYGSVVGYIDGKVVNTANFYTTKESSTKQMNNYKTGLVIVNKKDIVGFEGYQWNRLDLDFEKVWTFIEDEAPILQAFADKVIDVASVEKMLDYGWLEKAEGTKDDPYMIMDMGDLYGLADLSQSDDFAGKYFKLGADITINTGEVADWATKAPKYSWTSIGTSAKPFKGNFNGDGHFIKGIYQKTNARYAGFFASAEGITIKNLELIDSYFESTVTGIADFGGLVGLAKTTKVDTVYSNATIVAAGQAVAGMIGKFYSGSQMTNCWFAGSVTNTKTTDMRTGGLIGTVTDNNSSNSITNCLNTGGVSASKATGTGVLVGGLVGHVMSSGKLTMESCLNTGMVTYNTATSSYGSVLGGGSTGVNVTNVYATTESCGVQIGGTVTGSATAYAKNDITGALGYEWARLSLDFQETWTLIKGSAPVLKVFADKAGEQIDVTKVVQRIDYSWLDKAEGTKEDPYMIMDLGDLYGMAKLSQSDNFIGKHFKLGADITVNTGNAADWATKAPEYIEYSWTTIGTKATPFKGTFDGDNHTISGIYLKGNGQYQGFFAHVDSATVKNVRLVNSYLENNNQFLGGIAGVSVSSTIDAVYSDAIVCNSSKNSGGLIGNMKDTIINNCWFAGSVTSTRSGADNRIGGLVGRVSGGTNEITNCLNSGNVTAKNTSASAVYTGGLIGVIESSATLELKTSLNIGMIGFKDGSSSYGSIVGKVLGALVLSTDSKSYTANESCTAKGYSNSNLVVTSKANMYGDKALTKLIEFDFDNVWSTVPQNTPVQKTFIDIVYDTSWYEGHENDPTYVLYDRADLFGFAVISQNNTFAGKTIKLGADIEVNKGNAADWATIIPAFNWIATGNSTNKFAGTFDGQMHTISGIYLKQDQRYTGFFSCLGDGARVQNLKLVNSYFGSSQADLGCIAGSCSGAVTIDSVYSDAIVKGSNSRIGGLIGTSFGNLTVQYCWYAGTVTQTTTGYRYTGGILGAVYDNHSATIANCLNTGTVDVSAYTGTVVYAGGIVGEGKVGSTVTMKNNLMLGNLLVNEEKASGQFGLIIGYVEGSQSNSNNYVVTPETWSSALLSKAYGTSRYYTVARTDIIGESAITKLPAHDFNTIWATVKDSTPVLKKFEDVVTSK